MSFIIYELSKRQDIQQSLYEEIISIVGPDPSAEITHGHLHAMIYLEAVLKDSSRLLCVVPGIERIASSDVEFNLHAMIYLEAVLKESLRLLCVVPGIERIASSDVEFNGILYPKGTRFMFNIAAIHKSKLYFSNPEKFDPDRFMPDNGYGDQKNAFIPFSVGPRDCIGNIDIKILAQT
ncbi:cytochrome P450 [Oryctes borbonicus]|uniref:Cytochrome P450 n=1 Tax=Oryctes borbonicus TaxID=1629725 RepID=A0A0T6B6E3_9SCAR|nr:cytochrome P450 [Oryctes borbonicus]